MSIIDFIVEEVKKSKDPLETVRGLNELFQDESNLDKFTTHVHNLISSSNLESDRKRMSCHILEEYDFQEWISELELWNHFIQFRSNGLTDTGNKEILEAITNRWSDKVSQMLEIDAVTLLLEEVVESILFDKPTMDRQVLTNRIRRVISENWRHYICRSGGLVDTVLDYYFPKSQEESVPTPKVEQEVVTPTPTVSPQVQDGRTCWFPVSEGVECGSQVEPGVLSGLCPAHDTQVSRLWSKVLDES